MSVNIDNYMGVYIIYYVKQQNECNVFEVLNINARERYDEKLRLVKASEDPYCLMRTEVGNLPPVIADGVLNGSSGLTLLTAIFTTT